jgi:general secretion pathway protein L
MSIIDTLGQDIQFGKLGRTSWRYFREWYQRQASALLPKRLTAWLVDAGDRSIVIRPTDSGLVVTMLRGAVPVAQDRIDHLETEGKLGANTSSQRFSGWGDAPLGLDIDADQFLVRRFDVPAVAVPGLPNVLASEFDRKTPLKLQDVFHGYRVIGIPGRTDKVSVEHWIIRRDIVAALTERAGVTIDRIDFLRPCLGDENGNSGPRITIGRTILPPKWPTRLAAFLVVSACLLAVSGWIGTWLDQGSELRRIEAAIGTASTKAADVRQRIDGASKENAVILGLYKEKSEFPPVSDVWEEITRILPDGAWITELRMTEPRPGERSISIVGLAEAAAPLVALFDKSPLFFDTALTTAITPDPAEQRERFGLQLRLVSRSGKKS